MRGKKDPQASMLCLVSAESRVPADHPIRRIKRLADEVLDRLSPVFEAMYADKGRPSIPPESLLKAMLLIALYSVRSDRMFCERLGFDLMFQWFLDMDMLAEPFHHSTFSKNRERLMEHEVARQFFAEVVALAKREQLMSREHFSVDGTLIEAWASLKSFRPKNAAPQELKEGDDPSNPTINFHGEKRRNDTHASTTDPEARLMRKGYGKEAKLSYAQHVLMENRNGLIVDLSITHAHGRAEVEGALELLSRNRDTKRRITVGADKGYDTRAFVQGCRELGVTPHVAMAISRSGGSSIDARTSRHDGYSLSQRTRKKIEEIFGWSKTIGGFRKTRFRGSQKVELAALITGAAYNLLRVAKLLILRG